MADRNRARVASVALVLAASSALGACSGGGAETEARSSPTSSSPGPPAVDCRLTRGGPAQGSEVGGTGLSSSVKLKPGPAITAEEAAAEAPARQGTPLFLTGTVYAGDCRTPLAGAVIEVWQTDAEGVYGPGDGTGNLRCCYLQGTVKTDSGGRYTIETIRPGSYDGRPAHIHLNVHHGAGGVLTEVFFEDDPNLPDEEVGAEVIRLDRESNTGGKLLRGRFDIVVARTAE